MNQSIQSFIMGDLNCLFPTFCINFFSLSHNEAHKIFPYELPVALLAIAVSFLPHSQQKPCSSNTGTIPLSETLLLGRPWILYATKLWN